MTRIEDHVKRQKTGDFRKTVADKEVTQAKMERIHTKYNLEDFKKPVETQFRVRYSEVDSMGIVWHGNYFSWFEMGRLEHLRHSGVSYREVANDGYLFAVVHAECDFKRPARYDDLVTLTTAIEKVTQARIWHVYRLYRQEELLAVGRTVIVTLDQNGIVRRIPEWILKLSGSNFENEKGKQ